MARCQGNQEGENGRARNEQANADAGGVADPPEAGHRVGKRAGGGHERERLVGARESLAGHQCGSDDDQEERSVVEPHGGRPVEHQKRSEQAEGHSGDHRHREVAKPPDQGCGQNLDQGGRPQRPEAAGLAVDSRHEDQRHRRQQTRNDPSDGRDDLGADGGEPGQVGVGGRGPNCPSLRRALEIVGEGRGEDGDNDDHDQLGATHSEPENLPPAGERHRVPARYRHFDVGQRDLEQLAELGDSDGGDQEYDPWGAEQPGDHGEFQSGGGQAARYHRDNGRGPEWPAVGEHQQGQQAGRQHAERSHREVDDPASPVDQHDAESQQADEQAVDHPEVDDLAGQRDGQHQVSSRSVCRPVAASRPKNTARAKSSRSKRLWADPVNRT